jgi:tRNA (guanine37-N1)-methyltransferase
VRLDIITIFPEYFAPLRMSLIGKAVERGDISVAVHDLRAWAHDQHRTVDDAPFGGGPGMVMRPEPWGEALDAVLGGASPGETVAGHPSAVRGVAPQHGSPQRRASQRRAPQHRPPQHGEADSPGQAGTGGGVFRLGKDGPEGAELIVPTPAGALFDQAVAAELARVPHLVFACGRYEGIDARVTAYARTKLPVRELSIGDYVLAGGEPAVLVMVEAICRLLPGVLGNADSAPDDSFGAGSGAMSGLIEGPAYTRPRTWRGMDVPEVLLSGDHGAIARFRRDEALRRTAVTRPDLVALLPREALSARDRQLLSEAGFASSGEDVAH